MTGETSETRAMKVLPGTASACTRCGLPRLQALQLALGNEHLRFEWSGVGDPEQHRVRLHCLADSHRARGDDAGERRADLGVGELQLGEIVLGAQRIQVVAQSFERTRGHEPA